VPLDRSILHPAELLRTSPAEADLLLDELERRVPVRPPLFRLPAGSGTEAIVVGDTHGDWRSTEVAVEAYGSGDRAFIGLGDYVDRAPDDCGAGSVANALLLLELAAERPDRVVLIQGNHETVRRIPALPHNLPEEVDELWGPESSRLERLMGLLERGPLAVTTSSGAYLAHAGFPRSPLPEPWSRWFDQIDEEKLTELVWAECGASRIRRGAVPAWTARDLDRFLSVTGLRIVLRGHDPDLNGVAVYGGRCLTLHTSRVYERYGGVLMARLPLDMEIASAADVAVEHLPTEGREYSLPT
jgi:hypothetical protein